MRNKRLLCLLLGILALGGIFFNVFAEETGLIKIKLIDGYTEETINNRKFILLIDTGIRCITSPCPAAEDTYIQSDNNGYIIIPTGQFDKTIYISDDSNRGADVEQWREIYRKEKQKVLSFEKNKLQIDVKLFKLDTATIKITYEERQCIGNNGLSPERIKSSLEKKDIKVLKIKIPSGIEVPVCEACYPACSMQYEYEVLLNQADRELANMIISGLKTEIASRPQGTP